MAPGLRPQLTPKMTACVTITQANDTVTFFQPAVHDILALPICAMKINQKKKTFREYLLGAFQSARERESKEENLVKA